jgi:hypothetical protein
MDFTIKGVSIPLAYTIRAKKALRDEFDSPEALQKAFAVDNDVDLAYNTSRIAAIMAEAEWYRQKAEAALLGTEITARRIPQDDLFSLLDTDTTVELVKAITLTVTEANKTSVQADSGTPKNAEAGQ